MIFIFELYSDLSNDREGLAEAIRLSHYALE